PARATSRIGTTSNLGMGDPDRFGDGAESGFLEEGAHFLGDRIEHGEAFRDDRGPDLDGAGARHDVLEGVATGPDATDADDGDVDFLADVVHRAHADRSDRGAAEAAELVREERHLQLGHDRHRLHRIDRNDAVRAALLVGVLADHRTDDDRPGFLGAFDLVLVFDDPGIRQPDRVQQAGVDLDDRRVRVALPRLRSDALRDDGAGARLIDAGHGPAGFVE